MENVRANLTASNAPLSFWPELVEHAVDCLNRTTGPPDSNITSYESMTGKKPKVMSILPFGCLAYAVKPRPAYSKSTMDARAWLGVNLGRSSHTPGAYNIWISTLSKVVCTSEVYFDECMMPWRAKGDQRVGDPLPTAPPCESDTIQRLVDPITPPPLDTPNTLAEAYDQAKVGIDKSIARKSNKVLVLFSGSYSRPDGLAVLLARLGYEAVLLDNDPTSGGGTNGDILNDDTYTALLRRVVDGEFVAIIAAPPCSTFSVSRFYHADGSADGGPPVVRTRTHIHGVPDVPRGHKRELLQANKLVGRMVALLMAGYLAGSQYLVENPTDRGDLNFPRHFLQAEHGPLWQMPEIQALLSDYEGRIASFPMCAFGAPWQKLTSVMYSPGFAGWFEPLAALECRHGTHAKAAGGTVGKDGIS